MREVTPITLNLQAPNVNVIVHAKEGDRAGRFINAKLVDGAREFIPPANAYFAVRYMKDDGHGGLYDTMEDNETPAVTVSGNIATIGIAEQMLTTQGWVQTELNIYDANETRISAFKFTVWVEETVMPDGNVESTEYFNILTHEIALALQAAGAAETVINMTVEAETLEPGEEATVEKEHDPSAGTLNLKFGIPKGFDGKTAYQSAVDGGYTGTEAEFNVELSGLNEAATAAAASAAAAAQSKSDVQALAETIAGNVGIDDDYTGDDTTWSSNKIQSELDEQSSRIDNLNNAKKNYWYIFDDQISDLSDLFDNTVLQEGDVLYYDFDAPHGGVGYIEILDNNYQRITYIGKGTTTVLQEHYSGSYTIPSNFKKARVRATLQTVQTNLQINKMLNNKMIIELFTSNKELSEDINSITNQITDLFSYKKSVGIILQKDFLDGGTILDRNGVNVGDSIYYSFVVENNKFGYLDVLDENNTRITFIGKGGSSGAGGIFTGEYVIPQNFGKIVVKAGTSSSPDYLHINHFTTNKLINTILDRVTELELYKKSVGIILQKDIFNDTILLNKKDVNVGDSIFYKFKTKSIQFGYLDVLDENNTRITIIGKGGSSGDAPIFTGEYVIPQNFGKIVVKAGTSSSPDYLHFDYFTTNKLISNIIDRVVALETNNEKHSIIELEYDYNCETKNRLPNPEYTTFEKINESEQVLERETALNKSIEEVNGVYRIPTCIITNNDTILVASERRDNVTQADKGKISIDITRKIDGGSWERATTILPYNQSYGRYMDPCFVIDRTGVHGFAGRIYLFAGTYLNDDKMWAENTYEESNMIYIYSDDDGETWSDQISLKSKWESSEICVLPAPCNGIQLTNGTLVIPVFCFDGVRHNNALMYKKPNEDWVMTSKNDLVDYNINENTIVEYEENKVKIFCNNNSVYPRTQYKGQYDRYCTPTFVYDFSTDEYEQIISTYDRNLVCQFSIIKYNDIFLMSFPDTNVGIRQNATVWASVDCDRWIRCFKAFSNSSNGYSVLNYYNNKLVLVFEDTWGNISFEDISLLGERFENSCEKYITHVSSNDRIQLLFNKSMGL